MCKIETRASARSKKKKKREQVGSSSSNEDDEDEPVGEIPTKGKKVTFSQVEPELILPEMARVVPVDKTPPLLKHVFADARAKMRSALRDEEPVEPLLEKAASVPRPLSAKPAPEPVLFPNIVAPEHNNAYDILGDIQGKMADVTIG